MSHNNPAISKGIDWSIVGIYLLLVGIGIMAIFGATYDEGDQILQSFLGFKTDYSKQFYFFVVSVVIGLLILLTDSKFFPATANIWYVAGILLLLMVFPFHSEVKGTKSIIRLGGFQFQPAEFCKICVALALAKYLSRPETDFSKTRSQLIATAIVLFPAVLTILQKETGLALVFFSFFLVMYREGLPSIVLIVGFALATLVVATLLLEKNTLALILTGVALLIVFLMRRQIKKRRAILLRIIMIWFLCVGLQRFGVPFIFKNLLAKHQVERIYSTIGRDVPSEYMKGEAAVQGKKVENTADYNVKQSKIAIGSGGLLGKGLLKGTQTRYGFVPEQRTDFIFDTIGEGFGFVGSFILLCIYLFLLFRIITIAERQRSVFS
ncbi:MAG TPA: rod shape-determining protein RodA, partial [Chitinophagaceae bacterium]|nr:rod shape-determining protein RodA [Chitinophagaceae bacterium]